MSINLSIPEGSEHKELKPRITVAGVGGAGGNAVNNMIRRELVGVDFIVANTDAQALSQSRADRRIQLGAALTEGLGAGSKPDIGAAAAEEAREEVLHQLNGAHMVFLAAGMGGGTGTGAAPVIAKAAKEAGILTVAVVTKPFQFEGTHRMSLAEAGIDELAQYVDTLIIIPNQNLFRVATENTTFADAFAMADEVLYSGVRGVTDLMVMPGLINLDFADIRSVMGEMGKAMMGTGEATGERRALEAAEAAIANPLLDDTSMKGAKGVLINITGGPDITLFEVDEAATRIREEVDQDAYIIIGSAFDTDLDGVMRVSVVATGIDGEAFVMPQPQIMKVAKAIDSDRALETVPEETEKEKKSLDIELDNMKPAGVTQFEIVQRLDENTNSNAIEKPDTDGHDLDSAQDGVITYLGDSDVGKEGLSGIAPRALDPKENGEPLSAPAAMPREGGEDVFIPTGPNANDVSTVNQKPDPFAAAAMANGGPGTQLSTDIAESDRPSLFERVTRTGRAAPDRKEGNMVTNDTIAALQSSNLESKDLVSAQSAVGLESESTSSVEMEKLNSSEAEKVVAEGSDISELELLQSNSSEEDDLLDIPAFLRRQAN